MQVIGNGSPLNRRGKQRSCLGCPFFDEDGPPGLCSTDVGVLLERGCPQVGSVHLPREYVPDMADSEEASEELIEV